MPPISPPFTDFASSPTAALSPVIAAMRTQWENPKDVLSILMIVGGDIVQRGVAQLAGAGPLPFAPVAFSFGWVSYSLSTLTAALGDGRLHPPPEGPSTFINVKSGYSRANMSWVLSRLLRDEEHALAREHSGNHGKPPAGLTIAFYHVGENKVHRRWSMRNPECDRVYWIGALVIVVQLVVAIIPWAVSGNWVVFFVTAIGNLLTLSWTALPKLRQEKYAARPVLKGKREVSCLTKGNGSAVAMVFVAEHGLRLEDLAGGRAEPCHFTLCATLVSCVLWVLFLLTVQGLDGDAWYLFLIGSLGMAQNVYAAGARRTPAAHGFNLIRPRGEEPVNEGKVMKTLMNAEMKEKGVGRALLPIFFPGNLRPDEQRWWDKAQKGEFEDDDSNTSKICSESMDTPLTGQPVHQRIQLLSLSDVPRLAALKFDGSSSPSSSSASGSRYSGSQQMPVSLHEGERAPLHRREGTAVDDAAAPGPQVHPGLDEWVLMEEPKGQEEAARKR